MVWYFFREFSDIFPNNSFAEHHQAAASDFKKMTKIIMTKIIILIGRKYFFNYVAQNSYRFSIQTKLLTAHVFFKKSIKTKDYSKIVKTKQ